MEKSKAKDGLALLAVAAPPSEYVNQLGAADGHLQRHVREIVKISQQQKSQETRRSFSLMFVIVVELAEDKIKRWKTIHRDLQKIVADVDGSDSQSGLITQWNHVMKGKKLDPVGTKKTRKKWHEKKMQKKILKGLQWLWLLFDIHHSPDATAEEFVQCIFNTPWGWSLAMVSLAWHAVAVTRVKQALLEPTFETPPGFRFTKSRENQKLTGMPLTLAIDYLWHVGESTEPGHELYALQRAAGFNSWDLEAV